MASGNFFGGQFFGGGFFGAIASPVVGGHGSEAADDIYDEPRRVTIAGKPYTVTSKSQYLGLLARSKRDKAREAADTVIQVAQGTARDALQARKPEDSTAETARLLHALLQRQQPSVEELTAGLDAGIPIQLLMLIAADL